jgi:hypothetical protein
VVLMEKVKNIIFRILRWAGKNPRQAKAGLIYLVGLFGVTIAQEYMDIFDKILIILGVLF